MTHPRTICGATLGILLGMLVCAGANGQVSSDAKTDVLSQQLQSQLSGAVFVGHFTDDATPSDDGSLQTNEERYEIISAERMTDSNLWLIQARIKYSEKDMKVPVPVVIEWAGKTPVMTLDQVTIPGMGTFDARVVLTKTRYAGTWRHDQHGGHLFGHIERASKAPAAAEAP